MPLSTIFSVISVSFIGILYQPIKNTDMSQITVKLYHIIVYPVHIVMNMVLTRNFSGDSH